MAVGAILTAHHPDERLEALVGALVPQCSEIVVVDNTPGLAPRTPHPAIG